MTHLVVRRLLVDLHIPFISRWNGGDAFRSAFFNALSMGFPVGEQYFIDSVRKGLMTLPIDVQQRYAREVQNFVGQEATHRHIHTLFNGHLTRQGLNNQIEVRSLKRLKSHAHRGPHVHVAATAATEHFTAILAGWLLRHPEALEGAEPRMQTLWYWHCSEESEHRSTAFDIYTAMEGRYKVRMQVFRYITFIFLTDVLRQTVRNLWHDGSLFKWSTWRNGAKFLFSKSGVIRSNYGLWRDYLSPAFHPTQHDASLSVQWLERNSAQFSIVGSV